MWQFITHGGGMNRHVIYLLFLWHLENVTVCLYSVCSTGSAVYLEVRCESNRWRQHVDGAFYDPFTDTENKFCVSKELYTFGFRKTSVSILILTQWKNH